MMSASISLINSFISSFLSGKLSRSYPCDLRVVMCSNLKVASRRLVTRNCFRISSNNASSMGRSFGVLRTGTRMGVSRILSRKPQGRAISISYFIIIVTGLVRPVFSGFKALLLQSWIPVPAFAGSAPKSAGMTGGESCALSFDLTKSKRVKELKREQGWIPASAGTTGDNDNTQTVPYQGCRPANLHPIFGLGR